MVVLLSSQDLSLLILLLCSDIASLGTTNRLTDLHSAYLSKSILNREGAILNTYLTVSQLEFCCNVGKTVNCPCQSIGTSFHLFH